MPSTFLSARFVKDGQTVAVEIHGPWWPTAIFEREANDDKAANVATYEVIRAALLAEGHHEVED